MASTHRNIISNFIGNLWMAILTAIIIPLQINYLGIEAFALVGLIGTLQLIFNILDLGLSTSIIRVIASDRSIDKQESTGVVNTAMIFYWLMAFLIAIFILINSKYIANNFLNQSSLPYETIAQAIFIIGLSVAARWPVALYMGILSGLKKQDTLNFIKVICISLRLGVGIIIVMLTRDILVFLYWILFCSIFEIAYYYYVCRLHTPKKYYQIRLELASLKKIWKFSLAMNIIAILSMILINIDKIFVSKIMSLEDLGYYYLAYNVAVCLTLIQSSINSAMFPTLSEDFSKNNPDNFKNKYINITQLTIYVVALPAFIMIFYSYEGLVLWVGEEAASGSSLVMAILAMGFLITASISNSYIASIAAGKPLIAIKINIIAIIFYIPLMYFLIIEYGIVGASICWLILNVYYLFVQVPINHKLIFNIKYFNWLLKYFIPYMLLGIICFGGSKLILNITGLYTEILPIFILLLISAITYSIIGYILLSKSIKKDIEEFLRQIRILLLQYYRN